MMYCDVYLYLQAVAYYHAWNSGNTGCIMRRAIDIFVMSGNQIFQIVADIGHIDMKFAQNEIDFKFPIF